MKLRIHEGVLRIRLSEDDLRRCLEVGRIVESLGGSEPGGGLVYSLEVLPDGDSPSVELSGRGIRVGLSRNDAQALRRDPDGRVVRAIRKDGGHDVTVCVERDRPESCPAKAMNRPCPLRGAPDVARPRLQACPPSGVAGAAAPQPDREGSIRSGRGGPGS